MKQILKYQFYHVLAFIVMITLSILAFELWRIPETEFIGLPTYFWFIFSLAVPLVHQLYVTFGWRMELYDKTLTAYFGDKAFCYFSTGFYILGALRLVSFITLGIADNGSLLIDPALRYTVAVLLTIPALYTFYSVLRYFTLERAAGLDHFRPETFKGNEKEQRGMFKYSPNAIYKYEMLIVWALALFFASKALMISALFTDIMIWVLFYTTEKPDYDYIFSRTKPAADDDQASSQDTAATDAKSDVFE